MDYFTQNSCKFYFDLIYLLQLESDPCGTERRLQLNQLMIHVLRIAKRSFAGWPSIFWSPL